MARKSDFWSEGWGQTVVQAVSNLADYLGLGPVVEKFATDILYGYDENKARQLIGGTQASLDNLNNLIQQAYTMAGEKYTERLTKIPPATSAILQKAGAQEAAKAKREYKNSIANYQGIERQISDAQRQLDSYDYASNLDRTKYSMSQIPDQVQNTIKSIEKRILTDE